MPRAVLDPNVLVSALISPGGASARLLIELRDGKFELITSPKLLAELAEVLKRDKFRRYVTDTDVDVYVDLLERASIVVDDPDPSPQPLGVDPDDEYLITLAGMSRVDVLVSGDPHLTRLRGRIAVVTPREFVASLEELP